MREIHHSDFEQSYASVTDLSEASIADIARTHQIPCLAGALASIKELSAYVDGFVVRRYLYETLQFGSFNLKSPLDGRLVASKSSIFLANKNTFIFFEDFVVGVGHVGMGFPIMALIIPQKALFFKIVDDFWGIKEEQFPAVARILRSFAEDKGDDSRELQLLSGDPNFAHHAWNQLSALEAIVDCDLAKFPAQLISTHEPLGSTQSLFPELAWWNNYQVPDWKLEVVNKKNQMALPLGGSLIQKKLVNRLLRFVESNPKSANTQRIVFRAKNAMGPILWMSLRTRNRTASNLNEVIIAIGKRFLSDYPGGFIILDGHSIGCDAETNPGIDRAAQLEVVNSDMRAAEEIALAFAETGERPSPIELAIGLEISETIYLAQFAAFYFCHHGTVQHKIGWFSSCPGVVHSNVRTTESAPAPYVKGQSEVADLPVYVPVKLISEIVSTSSESDVENVLKRENYRFNDVPALVRFTCDLIDMKLLGKWQVTTSSGDEDRFKGEPGNRETDMEVRSYKEPSKFKKLIERLKGIID
ncbi:hypothetical protein [Caballeronia sp. dw_276]|uniref:hypothetical protein n=1 Tax=Caballeronia sp. dw_276 TaxID=2719795 RepID=UPI001BD64628|nr:hypothetical protein [Caballeronia sp. dw_276]